MDKHKCDIDFEKNPSDRRGATRSAEAAWTPHAYKNKNKNKNFIDPKQKYISSKVQPFRENQKQIKSIIVHVT